MQHKIEAKANYKDAGQALKIVSVGVATMFVCAGVALICLAAG